MLLGGRGGGWSKVAEEEDEMEKLGTGVGSEEKKKTWVSLRKKIEIFFFLFQRALVKNRYPLEKVEIFFSNFFFFFFTED